MKISIYFTGKVKNDFVKLGIKEYLKRMNVKGWQISIIESKKLKEDVNFILSEKGRIVTDEELREIFASALKKDLSFLIGPPQGFKRNLANKKNVISLSPLTFTSELTFLIFIEQLYRFYTIQKGKHYVR